MKKLDLGWGNSVCVRDAFLETYNGRTVVFDPDDLDEFNYPKHEGDPEVIEITRQVIKRQIGKEYKHVILTNGATGGVVIALRAYAQQGNTQCRTRNAPFYTRYPEMIKTSGLKHKQEDHVHVFDPETVILLDLPSNPLGLMSPLAASATIPIIIDGVYYNNVYTPGNIVPLPHNVMVGSYSKLLGLNGIRLGWIATDDDFLYERIRMLVTSEYCGLSMASTILLKNILKQFRWDLFENSARASLNINRAEWAKLEKYFGDTPVIERGMFYYAPMDEQCKKLMEKSGITWMSGKALGTFDDHGRINLGQDCELIREAVRSVLKNDKI